MTDAVVTQALREELLAFAREQFELRALLWAGVSTAIFAAAIYRNDHWVWWLAGLPAALLIAVGLGWLAMYLWWPRLARSHLDGLPHRTVQIEFTLQHLAIETATERFQIVWSELTDLKRLPHFWMFCLKSGVRIPVPVSSIDESMAAHLQQHRQVCAGGPPSATGERQRA